MTKCREATWRQPNMDGQKLLTEPYTWTRRRLNNEAKEIENKGNAVRYHDGPNSELSLKGAKGFGDGQTTWLGVEKKMK